MSASSSMTNSFNFLVITSYLIAELTERL